MDILFVVDLERVDRLILDAIVNRVTPGACYVIGSSSGESYIHAVGRHTYEPDAPATTAETVWDLASLTKVVGTTTAAMLLYEAGILDLDQRVAEVLPEFGSEGKDKVTFRNLLLHNSGLAASHPCSTSFADPYKLGQSILSQPLVYLTGTQTLYSDLGFISLGLAIEALTNQKLETFLQEQVWAPLSMLSTWFNPSPEVCSQCAPTERVEPWRSLGGEWAQGQVHDPTAAMLGGAAGHAGLFSTAGDLAKFMTVMMNKGGSLVNAPTVELFTSRASAASSRALGWDTPSDGSSAGALLGPRSFGHTGFTGTSIWADPDRDLFAVLLTNRVHPNNRGDGILTLRRAFHDAVVGAHRYT